MSNEEEQRQEQQAALVPVAEKQIDFYGDEITAVLIQSETKQRVYVPIKPISDNLGLSWSGQSERIRRDPVLSEEMDLIRVTRIKSIQGRGRPESLCLPLEFLPGWLFGINVTRVKPEWREKLIRYQRECFMVLWDAFQNEVFAVVEQPATNPNIVALNQVREMGLSIVRLAEQQLETERRLDTHHNRLNQAAVVVGNLQQRMNNVEQVVLPGNIISEAQAANISTAVKALAEHLTTTAPKKNHYSGIFAELYRRFQVTNYTHIQQKDYRAVLNFLNDWGRAAGAGAAPEQGLLEL